MEKQVTPVQIMQRIVELMNKLVEGGYATTPLTIEKTTRVIEGQLVVRFQLKRGNAVAAEWTSIDPRPLEQIKTEYEAQRQAREAKFNEEVAVLDEVVTVVDTELAK